MNDEMIDHAIGLLMMQNEEDAAAEIERLRVELERVKQIARDRLTTIRELRDELAQLEENSSQLEDHGGLWGAECRGELDE